MSINASIGRIRALLEVFATIDIGYPKGDNVVNTPRDCVVTESCFSMLKSDFSKQLRSLYSACDGISLPDIHIGYFIHPLDRVLLHCESGISYISATLSSVLLFGSTGGGGSFVIRESTSDILYLHPGPVNKGIYSGDLNKISVVANDVESFVAGIARDIEAFISGRPHRFIVD